MVNILWICTDQQRFDALGCYGNAVLDTPNLDSLAEKGVLFENCYAQSPVCSPSRGSFLTGRYPRTCNMRQNGAKIPSNEKLVTKIFEENGYLCGLSGKLHLAPCHPSVCPGIEERIEDGYSAFYWSHHSTYDWPLNDYHLWLAEKGYEYHTAPYQNSRYVLEGMPEELHHSAYCTDRAITFLRSAGRFHTPWLFSINYYDPHHDFDPPKRLLDKYMERLDQILLPNYQEGELEHKPRFQRQDHSGAYAGNAGHAFTEMSERDHKMHTAAYYAMVEMIDIQVGRLLEALRESGQDQDTLIVFHSDHGEMLGDHGIYLKGPYFYEGAVKVPLILYWPGKLQEGKRVKGLVELMDLPQTLLELAGIPAPSSMMGKSFAALCTDQEAQKHRDSVYAEYYNAMPWHQSPKAICTMVFDGRYKLVVCHGIGEGELYDLAQDPAETDNLWDSPESANVKMKLLLLMTDRMAFTCDPLPERVSAW